MSLNLDTGLTYQWSRPYLHDCSEPFVSEETKFANGLKLSRPCSLLLTQSEQFITYNRYNGTSVVSCLSMHWVLSHVLAETG